jgi:hypothetical protein
VTVGVVGDVHGNVAALEGLLNLVEHRYDRLVLVGDYVNRGTESAAVLQLLVERASDPSRYTLLAGNHDRAFLACLDSGELQRFLMIGGAATIRSYIADVAADVLRQVRDAVPASHLALLRSLEDRYHEDGLLITHDPRDRVPAQFHVYGHIPQRALVPVVTATSAAVDTGCGTLPNGRLSCLSWPSLEVIQVDGGGREVKP